VQVRYAIIGAGVVGLAIAERLSRRTSDVVVLEAAQRTGQGTTSRNSQVLHAGLYYPAGSLKARLCVLGNRSLREWCQTHGVRLVPRGKLIVAQEPGQLPELERLLARGRENGVRLAAVDPAFVAQREPDVPSVGALWSPDTAVLDAHGLVGSLGRAAQDRGVVLALEHRVVGLAPGWKVTVEGPDGRFELSAEVVVNAAGLHADTVLALTGLDVDRLGLRQHWVKGRYARVRARRAVRHLVYPVPSPQLAGLGVHLTIDVDGELRLGPDVVALPSRVEDYAVDEQMLPGFFEAGRRLLPWLEPGDLTPDTAGLRPKLTPADGPWRDFSVSSPAPGLIALAGIESPGLTCCLELACLVDELLRSG
jgi:L-2-hydroxyglutarate oxidase LhgO